MSRTERKIDRHTRKIAKLNSKQTAHSRSPKRTIGIAAGSLFGLLMALRFTVGRRARTA